MSDKIENEVYSEWEFRLFIDISMPFTEDETHQTTDLFVETLIDLAISWAEDRRLGIGGGVSKLSLGYNEKIQEMYCWALHFGLCATQDSQTIPWQSAVELLNYLVSYAKTLSLNVTGGCGPFGHAGSWPPLQNEIPKNLYVYS